MVETRTPYSVSIKGLSLLQLMHSVEPVKAWAVLTQRLGNQALDGSTDAWAHVRNGRNTAVMLRKQANETPD